MDNKTKVKYLDEKAKVMTERALVTERQYKDQEEKIKRTEEASDMLIDAIQAKVAILDAI